MAVAKCESCKHRLYAEQNPKSFRARLWYWHTKFCPGWRAYQRELAAREGSGPKR